MRHHCHAHKCFRDIPPKLLMCRQHWKMVPRNIQTLVWKHYRPGQEVDKQPSHEYLKAQQLAVAAVILAETGLSMEDQVKLLEAAQVLTKPKKGKEMKVSEAKYTRRYTTDVQYEYEEFTVTAVVEDDDNAREVLSQLKADVEAVHAGESSTGSTEDAGQDQEETEEETKPEKKGKKSKRKPTTIPEEESEEEDSEDTEEETEEDSEGDTEEEADEEAEDEEEKKPAKKPAGKSSKKSSPGKKGARKTGAVYSRSNEIHKKLFSEQLGKIAPNWKSSEKSKAKAKKLSQDLQGKEFMDADGKIVSSFIIAMRKGMIGK